MFKLGNICRSCMSSEEMLFSLKTCIGATLKVADCFKQHLGINVSEDDGLPTGICIECLDKLLLVRRFHLLCLESERCLLKIRSNQGPKQLEASGSNVVEHGMNSDVRSSVGTIHTPVEAVSRGPSTGRKINTTGSENSFVSGEYSANDSDNCSYDDVLEENVEFIDEEASEYLHDDDSIFEQVEILDEDGLEQHENVVNDSKNVEVKGGASNLSKTCDTDDESDSVNDEHNGKKGNYDIFLCPQCCNEYATNDELEKHFREHKEDTDKGFCIQCSIKFPSREILMNHLQKHINRRTQYICQFCDKVFSKRFKLKNHLRIHTGERPYVCKVCGRAFCQSIDLRTHSMIHTGKPLKCPECDKRFCRKTHLNVHLRKHYNIRPYACDMCEEAFIRKAELTSHKVRKHTTERNFVCHVCGQTFKEKVALSGHLKTHSRPYQCPECPMKCAQLYGFRKHLVNTHNILDDPKQFINEIDAQMA